MNIIFKNFLNSYITSSTLPNPNIITNKKKQILDPITCIIRLALLSFKNDGTKISISMNRIIYQPPNILQGTFRWASGDNRSDLHNLCEPIENVLLWYNVENKIIKELLKYSVKGLIKLKNSYDESNLVSHSLIHYINLIENCIQEKKEILESEDDNKKFKKEIIKKSTMFREVEQYNKILKLKKIWNEKEITGVYNLLELINEENCEYITNSINIILEGKENKTFSVISELMTSIN